MFSVKGFSTGEPTKPVKAKKTLVSIKKTCEDYCDEIKAKEQDVTDLKDQAHEKGMDAKEKAKIMKKVAKLKTQISELKQDLHKKKCPKCEADAKKAEEKAKMKEKEE